MKRKPSEKRDTIFGINLDQIEKAMKDGDKSLNPEESINIDKMQNDAISSKKDYNVSDFMRISVNISEDNLSFLKEYQTRYGVPVATKSSELLNDAVEKLRKDAK